MSDTVAVFFGGNSNEREISVITGMLAVNLLRSSRFRVLPVYLSPEGEMLTADYRSPADLRTGAKVRATPVRLERQCVVHAKKGKKIAQIAIALNCCHGGMGEDGTLSALLRWNGILSASPETPVSAVFMDKTLTKIAARGLDIPVARFFSVREREWRSRDDVLARAQSFGYPLIVKPAKLGSSIGIRVAKNAAELTAALDLAFRLDDSALIEEYLEGKRDINCAAYRSAGKTVLSPPEEVFSDRDILTFAEKYEEAASRHSELPARLPEGAAVKINAYTQRIYEAFGGRGVVRADFLVVGDDVFFNELNTVPGSLACYLFGKSLTESREFLLSLLEEALSDPPREKEIFVSGILEGNVFSGKSRKRL